MGDSSGVDANIAQDRVNLPYGIDAIVLSGVDDE
jgi:hypothetical protein